MKIKKESISYKLSLLTGGVGEEINDKALLLNWIKLIFLALQDHSTHKKLLYCWLFDVEFLFICNWRLNFNKWR